MMKAFVIEEGVSQLSDGRATGEQCLGQGNESEVSIETAMRGGESALFIGMQGTTRLGCEQGKGILAFF